ncbi:MAG: ATP-binding cassette domain-containing protein, partial [Fimbriimonadaceae bacterium]|nr:ATP-binding cassette domain-containing protein [Alphaproteobacteria bacterium]
EWVAADLTSAAISVKDLCKSFKVGRPVLENINFDVAPSSLVALIGANGTGKSTLLRLIPRLIEPDKGDIAIFSQHVAKSGKQLRQVRKRIGFVFQKHNLVGRLSALTNVIHGAQARGFGFRAWGHCCAPQFLRNEAMACLERVGLADVAGQRADSLSGGQSQRVAIARALMQRPEIVLADEPAASLDPQAGDEVMRLFLSLMREEKKTVVFTSHNLSHALDYADRVVGLGEGKVVLDMLAAGLRESDLRELYV